MIYKHKQFLQAELQGQDYEQDIFIGCTFSGISFKYTTFSSCHFKSCDLSGVLLELTNFSQCHFPESKLSYIDFGDAIIKACDFSGSVLIETTFQQYKTGKRRERTKSNLIDCNFSNADLSSAVFTQCSLESVPFINAHLEHAVFERCNLTKTDFTGAHLSGCSYPDSKIDHTLLDAAGFFAYGQSKGFVLADP